MGRQRIGVIHAFEQLHESLIGRIVQRFHELLQNDIALAFDSLCGEIGLLYKFQQQRKCFIIMLLRAEVIDRPVVIGKGVIRGAEQRKFLCDIAVLFLKELMLQIMCRTGRKLRNESGIQAAELLICRAEFRPELRIGGAEIGHLHNADLKP